MRNDRAALVAELDRLLDAVDGQDARHDGNVDTGRPGAFDELEVDVRVEEELRDRVARAGFLLGEQDVDVGLRGRRLRMDLGIACHGDIERVARAQCAHEARDVLEPFVAARFGIPAQGHQPAMARSPQPVRVVQCVAP